MVLFLWEFAVKDELAVLLKGGHGLDGFAVEVESLHERSEFCVTRRHLRSVQDQVANVFILSNICVFHRKPHSRYTGFPLLIFLLKHFTFNCKKEKKKKKRSMVLLLFQVR